MSLQSNRCSSTGRFCRSMTRCCGTANLVFSGTCTIYTSSPKTVHPSRTLVPKLISVPPFSSQVYIPAESRTCCMSHQLVEPPAFLTRLKITVSAPGAGPSLPIAGPAILATTWPQCQLPTNLDLVRRVQSHDG